MVNVEYEILKKLALEQRSSASGAVYALLAVAEAIRENTEGQKESKPKKEKPVCLHEVDYG